MMIDVFNHILPKRYLEERNRRALSRFTGLRSSRYAEAVPTLTDLSIRFKIMDKYEEYVQVLTIAAPPLEDIASPEDAVYLAKVANDELAELVAKYPDRFVAGVACLPMNAIDEAPKEIDRAIKELRLRGILIYTDVGGETPRFSRVLTGVREDGAVRPTHLHPPEERGNRAGLRG